MHDDTIHALNAVNQRFYEQRADEFDRTRERPWRGWHALFDRIEEDLGRPPRVLDVGCGNGRFARFLHERGVTPFDYVGIDASPLALAHAKQRLSSFETVQLLEFDVVARPEALPDEIAEQTFDLVVAFGLLHHVPGRETRQKLLNNLSTVVADRGLLVYTVWHFDRFERFTRKLVPWEEFLPSAPRAIRLRDLEPGDHIMTWGATPPAHRYCHAMSDAEARALADSLPLAPVAKFEGDDALNTYYVFRRDGSSS